MRLRHESQKIRGLPRPVQNSCRVCSLRHLGQMHMVGTMCELRGSDMIVAPLAFVTYDCFIGVFFFFVNWNTSAIGFNI